MDNKKLDLKKICIICKEKINFKKDRYVNIKDFNGKICTDECFYHLDCWRNRFKLEQKIAMEEFVKPMLNQLQNKILTSQMQN